MGKSNFKTKRVISEAGEDVFFCLEREKRSSFFSFRVFLRHKKERKVSLNSLSLLIKCLFSTKKQYARARGGAAEASSSLQGRRRAGEAMCRGVGGEEEERRRRQWRRRQKRSSLASSSRRRPGHARHLRLISLRREHDSHCGPCSGAEVRKQERVNGGKRDDSLFFSDVFFFFFFFFRRCFGKPSSSITHARASAHLSLSLSLSFFVFFFTHLRK